MPITDNKQQHGERSAGRIISFFINGKKHSVNPQSGVYSVKTTLTEYIRSVGLTGIKVVCQEAACGACAVTVTVPGPLDPACVSTHTINACLCPLYRVDGWQITTIEALGNNKEGYHPIQQNIAKANGSQCGFCTPGVVMSMYGLLHEKSAPTKKDIEDNFDGNLCRCTGYRAILDSMKSFGVDNDESSRAVIDIEDLNKKLCPRTGQLCQGQQPENRNKADGLDISPTGGEAKTPIVAPLELTFQNSLWLRPVSLKELGTALQEYTKSHVKMVFGNTAAGIHKKPFDVYIDISQVKELSLVKVHETGVQIGANVTLSNLIARLDDLKASKPGFAYFDQLVQHLKLVGNVIMRNAASLGGNLYLRYIYPAFPSDIFTLFEAAGATATIYDSQTESETTVCLEDMVKKTDMQGKVITSVHLPALLPRQHFCSFKVAPRSQNALAYVNAAFKFTLSEDGKQILGQPSFVFGGIDDKLIHAQQAEAFFTGKEITTAVIQDGMAVLRSELCPTTSAVLASPEYRRDLAANLLYKAILGLGNPSDPKLSSGKDSLQRPVSTAVQTFQEKKEDWPLKQPLPKKTALMQTSGEAIFINDMPKFQHELSAAFVLSTVASAQIESVDPSAALEIAGVVQYLSASDLPANGRNDLFPWSVFNAEPEEILSSGKIYYAGQPIGLIVAESQGVANEAAKKVLVKYADIQQPILSIEQGIAANSFHPTSDLSTTIVGDPDGAFEKAENVVEGEVSMGTQYHFYLENQISLCVPSEDGVDLYSSTQYSDAVQAAVAGFLGQPTNYVNMYVPRLGGAFGGKQVTSVFPAAAAALASYNTGKPVRMNMSLSDCMAIAGKRFPVLAKYKAGYTNEGKLQVVMVDIYIDGGHAYSCNAMLNEIVVHMDHGYYVPNWKIRPFNVKTNKPTNLACRSPGPVPALLIIETILEHVAKSIQQHPIMVKEINLYDKDQTDLGGHILTYCTMKEVWSRLKTLADVDARILQVQSFNQTNQWKKRGLTMNGIKHGLFWCGSGFPAQVSIFAADGTVVVSQSGVEMGQGLYMKIAQATAHALGISVEQVKVRPNQSLIGNNAMLTGGSTTSEQCVYAVQQCCKELKERLAPVKAENPHAEWPTLCRKALDAKVDLGARYNNFGAPGSPHFNYFSYCAGVFETELDVLTGEYLVRRVDIMYDCGESLNPLIDIGQIEGGFIMGLGHHLMEDVIYDASTGRVLNDGTWNYKLPTTKDIPIDWRIHLLPDAPNPVGINSSKATGEPPVAMGCGPALALRQAMEEAVQDLTGSSTFITLQSPLTVERVQQGCKVEVKHLRL